MLDLLRKDLLVKLLRQLSIPEAVAWIMRSLTLEYRQLCLLEWREKFGDGYADEVEAKVKQQWKVKK